MKKTLLIVAIPLVVVLSVSYIFFIEKDKKVVQQPVKMEKLSIATTSSGALLFITKEQGFFNEYGLEVELKPFSSGKAAGKALIDDQVNLSTTADAGFVSYSFSHGDLKVLASITSANLSELVARKDRDISTISDLKGKKIGVTKNTTSDYFLEAFLIDNLISPDDVQYVYLKPKEIVDAMLSGEIDACHVWHPHVYKIQKVLGSNHVSWPAQVGQPYHFLLMTKEKWIDNNKDIAKRLINALAKGEDFVSSNLELAKDSYAKLSGLKGEALDLKWKGMQLILSLDQSMLIHMENQARFKIQNKQVDSTTIPNYMDFIHYETLESVSKDSVTIFR